MPHPSCTACTTASRASRARSFVVRTYRVIEERKEPLGGTECERGLAQSGMLAKGEQRRSQRASLFAPLSLYDIAAMPRIVPPAVVEGRPQRNLTKATKGRSSGATDFSAVRKEVREIVS